MVLARLIKGIVSAGLATKTKEAALPASRRRRMLNVGGGSKEIAVPQHYGDWEHLLLDIAPGPDTDIVKDARDLVQLNAAQFDAVYCSHNLEHYFQHDAAKVLAGFMHVLKADGFAEIRVPDMKAVIQHVASTGMDLDDMLYQSSAGPITAHDVIYGWGKQIESSGVDFYAHKCGFTAESLIRILSAAGFQRLFVMEVAKEFEVRALAFKQDPNEDQVAMLNL